MGLTSRTQQQMVPSPRSKAMAAVFGGTQSLHTNSFDGLSPAHRFSAARIAETRS